MGLVVKILPDNSWRGVDLKGHLISDFSAKMNFTYNPYQILNSKWLHIT